MADVRISVGAYLDERATDVTFSNLEQKARRSAKSIANAMGGTGAGGGPWKAQADAATKAAEQMQKAQQRALASIGRDARRAEQEMRREWARSTTAYSNEQQNRIRMRERRAAAEARAERLASRAAQREAAAALRQQTTLSNADRRIGETFARRTSWQALLNVHRLGRYGARAVRDIALGAGVDVSLGGSLGRGRERETLAVGLAQQERIATGSTIGTAAYRARGAKVANALAVGEEDVTRLTRAFGARAGIFGEKAEALTPGLARMAVATGADFEQMGDSAAFVYNQLKKLPDAGERTLEILRGIAGQTAIGSVEFKDYASQMGRISANAGMFAGDRGENILKMSALAQMVFEAGGGTSAADASRALVSFVNTLQKRARLKAFTKGGVRIFEDSPDNRRGTILRDPFEILKDSIVKTKGDIPTLSAMYMDVLGRKPLMGLKNLANVFTAGGTRNPDEIRKAMDAERDRYLKTTMGAGVEEENIQTHLQSRKAKAQQWQNTFDRIVDEATTKVLPSIERAAPALEKLVATIADTATWMIDNPKKTIGIALGAAIAEAGIGSLFRAAVDKAILTGMFGQAGGGLLGGGSGALLPGAARVAGAAGLGSLGTIMLTAAAVTLTAATVWAAIDKFVDQKPRSTVGQEGGGPGPRAETWLEESERLRREAVGTGGAGPGNRRGPGWGRPSPPLAANMSIGGDRLTPEQVQSSMSAAMKGTTIEVVVKNIDELKPTGPGGGAQVDSSGRTTPNGAPYYTPAGGGAPGY